MAAGLSVAIAELLQLPYPVCALIAAVIVTDLSPVQTRELGLRRLAGTLLGAAAGAALSHLLSPGPWVVGLSILAAMFLSHVLHLEGAAKITGYICGVIVFGGGDNPWFDAFHRLVETLLGAGVALLVSFVPKLIPHDESK